MENADFVDRLIDAFGTDKPAEIEKRAGVSYQGAKNYLLGRLPQAEELLKISSSTNVSIHWLLTGEGPKEREVIKAIKNGDVNINKIKHEALINYHLEEVKVLLKTDDENGKSNDMDRLASQR